MDTNTDSQKPVKQRPNLFRALGKNEPPASVRIGDREFALERIIKHDSWAATALYLCGADRIVCKFNRVEPILFVPAGWLGRWLARRESAMYRRLADLPNIANGYDQVFADGRLLKNAAAHDYIEGHPLSWHDRVRDDFFDRLRETLAELHRRGIAYVDLNKWENIIVDSDGNPCLIDFQISVKLPRIWPVSTVLKILQNSDLYHLSKHASRIRPDLYNPEHFAGRPWWIRMHRKIANPFRAFRRRLLVTFGVRKGKGKPQSEQFIEEGLRETGGNNTAIERLYDLLKSRQYVDCAARSNRDFVDAVFSDLLGRPPGNLQERELTDRLKGQTRHDQLIWLLKSPAIWANSQGWGEGWIEQRIRNIGLKLAAAEEESRRHAA